jgi:hypothetical protein
MTSRIVRHLVRPLDGLLDRICAVAGALVFSQAPAFMAHYLQRLSGHVDEAARHVKAWQAMADRIADGRLEALIRMGRTGREAFGLEAAEKCAADLARHETLSRALEAMRSAPVWSRAASFARHADMEIARAAWRDFTPSLPLDVESLVYALLGLLAGFAAYILVKKGGGALWRTTGARAARRLGKARRRSSGHETGPTAMEERRA